MSDLKSMTNEELVNKLRSVSYVSGTNDTDDFDDEIFDIKSELLRRLAVSNRAVEAIKELILTKYALASRSEIYMDIEKIIRDHEAVR